MRILILLCCLFALSGCAAAYEPYSVEISKPGEYAADLKLCQSYAAAYSPKFDATGVAEAAGQGAGGNAGAAAVTWWAPVFGAVGAVTSTLLADAGVTQGDRDKITARCIEKKTGIDGSALALDPKG